MTTPTRGVPVHLDRLRHLRYSLADVREIQREARAAENDDEAAALTGKMLWLGLRHDDPDLTVEAVESMVFADQVAELMEKVQEACGQKPGKAVSTPRKRRS